MMRLVNCAGNNYVWVAYYLRVPAVLTECLGLVTVAVKRVSSNLNYVKLFKQLFKT